MKIFQIVGVFILLVTGTLSAQNFEHNFESSLALAQEENKQVLMIFSGSDWCKPCMQLKKDILANESFEQYSTENLVLLEVDFPYRRKNRLPKEQRRYNDQLAEQYNKQGSFPKVLLFDSEKNRLGQVDFKPHQTVDSYIYQIEALTNKSYN